MKKLDIKEKLADLSLGTVRVSDASCLFRLAMTLANTRLANKTYKLIKELNSSDKADEIIRLLKK